jgi:hypothetical protein
MGRASAIRDLPPVHDCGVASERITIGEALRLIRQRARPVAGSEMVAPGAADGLAVLEEYRTLVEPGDPIGFLSLAC